MNQDYDVIIIGSGIGGMISAALLSKQGYKIAILEKEQYLGGYCTSFKNGDFDFDIAVDSIGALKKNAFIRNILDKLDVSDKLDFIELDPIRRNIFPDMIIDVPADLSLYEQELSRLFFSEKQNIHNLFSSMKDIYSNSLHAILGNQSGSIELFKYMQINFEQFLSNYIKDKKLKAILSTYCTFLGLSASEVSALIGINTLMHYVKDGAFRIKGGFSKLIVVLENIVISNGGEIFKKEKVEKIIVKNNKAIGVKSENKELFAEYIISNIDVKTLINTMLDEEVVSLEKKSKINSLEVSGSFIIVYLGLDMDLSEYNLVSSIGYFSSYDLDAMLNFSNENITYGLSIPSIIDKSIVKNAKSNAIIHYPLTCHGANLDKIEIAEKLIKSIDTIIPGISNNIVLKRVADSKTLYRYTGNSRGAAYGWQQKKDFYTNASLLKNLADNFYIAGHWSGLGGGVMPSVVSAVKVVEEISKQKVLYEN